MNSFKLMPKRNWKYTLVLFSALTGIFGLSSCNKNDDEVVTPDSSISNLKLVHSLPNFSSVDFYLDGQKATQYALTYSQATGYGNIYSGTHQVGVAVGGTDLALSIKNHVFEKDKNYSLFVTTKGAANDTITTLLTTDDLTAPVAGKAKVRFVHLSQNAPALDLALQGGANIFTNTAYNSFTQFSSIDPGTLTFQIKDTGTSNVRASSSQAVTIEAGKIYTIWAEGLVNGQGSAALGVQVLQN